MALTKISGSIIKDSVSLSGNVSVGGTLTYEDVTNVDAVGIVTARSGIKVLAGGINAVGVITATSFVGSGANLTGISGFATAMSSTPNTLLNECFKTTEAFTIPNGTQVDITNNETTSGKTVFTRLAKINVATGGTFHVSAGTTFIMNVLGVFP